MPHTDESAILDVVMPFVPHAIARYEADGAPRNHVVVIDVVGDRYQHMHITEFSSWIRRLMRMRAPVVAKILIEAVHLPVPSDRVLFVVLGGNAATTGVLSIARVRDDAADAELEDEAAPQATQSAMPRDSMRVRRRLRESYTPHRRRR